MPSFSINLPKAWKAPLALKAPILCWFSHLKNSLTFGFEFDVAASPCMFFV
jgi:hypothetical protein